jgi:proline racemase
MRLQRIISAVDVHAGGEPGRVIIGGVPEPPGRSVHDKMEYLRDHADNLRQLMLREPRGYPALCCNLIVQPSDPSAAAGFVIMEQTEYPLMSGSNTICVATVLLETGLVPMHEPITEFRLEAPAGPIRIRAAVSGVKVTSVTLENVPAFAIHLDVQLEVPGIGTLTVDVAFGGMFYVILDATQVGFRVTPDEAADLVRIGETVKAAAQDQLRVTHPTDPSAAGITVCEFTAPPMGADADGRNTVVISTGARATGRGGNSARTGILDRSACGTGTSARMAVLHAKGLLPLNQDFRHESILDSVFTGRLVAETKVGDRDAVISTITGSAWIYGLSQYVVDPDDPFPHGYQLADVSPS